MAPDQVLLALTPLGLWRSTGAGGDHPTLALEWHGFFGVAPSQTIARSRVWSGGLMLHEQEHRAHMASPFQDSARRQHPTHTGACNLHWVPAYFQFGFDRTPFHWMSA